MKTCKSAGSISSLYGIFNIGLCLTLFALAQCFAVEGAENIALHKSYTLTPSPNYDLCKDADDLKQITDGEYALAHKETGKRLWVQNISVGWRAVSPVIITIDLGEVQPVSGISYSTAADAGAGVLWPREIIMLASKDNKSFQKVGELISMSVKENGQPPSEYSGSEYPYKFRTGKLQASGRYISFVVYTQNVSPDKPYFFTFVDEIEVYRGGDELLNIDVSGETYTSPQDFVKNDTYRGFFENGLLADISVMEKTIGETGITAEAKQKISEQLAILKNRVPNMRLESKERLTLPMNSEQERFFNIQAMLWREMGYPALQIWQSGLWEPLSHTQLPPKESKPSVDVSMMQNEYRAASFNISNSTDKAVVLSMAVTGLPGGYNPAYVTVHQVEWTGTKRKLEKTGIPVADALPVAKLEGGRWMIEVLPGLTRQVWLTFHSKDVLPGTYNGAITLSGDKAITEVPLTLKVFPVRFPDRPTLHLGGWDYIYPGSRDVTDKNRDLILKHMREHFVDSPWGDSSLLGFGKYDAEGNMVSEPSTENLDKWLKIWADARRYCIFLYADYGSERRDKEIQAWAAFWAKHIREKGLNPEQFFILIADEPYETSSAAKVILHYAKNMRAAGAGFRIWTDPTYSAPEKAGPEHQEMMESLDVICPNRTIFLAAKQPHRDYYLQLANKGIGLEFYSCDGPARLNGSYSYYRLQAWDCWKYGAKASHFWAFSDGGGMSSWNEYASSKSSYAPFFLDAVSVTAGKQMEAIREGVEDYEYLVILQNAVNKAVKAGIQNEVVESGKKLLVDGVNSVCDNPKDRTLADKTRMKILDAIAELSQLTDKL